MSQKRIALLVAAAAAAILGSIVGCHRGAPAPAATETRLLVIDGLEIHFADVEPLVAYLDSFLPEAGHKVKIQRVIDEQVLPLLVARRAFPEQRDKLFAEAQNLCSVATNAYELDKQSEQIVHRVRRNQTRLQPRLPVSKFFFDRLTTGAVSPPIEVPQGYIVAAAFELHESPLATDDYVDGLQVGFVTHNDADWKQWYEEQKKHLADKATFVHPDYRGAMPEWIHLPKQE